MTKSGKELHLWQLKSSKEKLSGFGIDPFTLGYPIDLSRAGKLPGTVN